MYKLVKPRVFLNSALFIFTLLSGPVFGSSMGFVETIRENDPGTGGGDNPQRSFYFPSGVSTSSDGNNVYMTAKLDSALTSFNRDMSTGQLTIIDTKSQDTGTDGLGGVIDVITSPDGKHVYTIGNGDIGTGSIIESTILTFTRNTNGILTQTSKLQARDLPVKYQSITDDRFAFSPDGNFLYITARHSVFVFQRSSVTGALTFIESTSSGMLSVTFTDALRQANGLSVSPDGKNLYVVGANTSATSGGDLVVLGRDISTGKLSGMEIHVDLLNGITDMKTPEDVAVSPDGSFVYVVADASDTSSTDSVVVFSRANDGALIYQSTEHYVDNGSDVFFDPRRISISPSGNLMYIATAITETISVFSRDHTTGNITPLGFERDGLRGLEMGGVTDMDMSPDGKFLYAVTEQKVDGISVFDLSADLVIDKTSPATVATASPLTYTITATNTGASDATSVEVIDVLANELTFINASTSAPGGSCALDINTVTCNINRIASGSGETITIDVTTPDNEATIVNEASANIEQVDNNLVDNTDSVSTLVSDSAPISEPTPEPASGSGSGSGSLDYLSLLFICLLMLIQHTLLRSSYRSKH